MLLLVQFTRSSPRDWEEYEHTAWPFLPQLPIHALNVQGVVFEGYDHYAVEDGPEGSVVVSVWNDPTTNGDPWQQWTIAPLAPDPAFGGLLNTRQTVQWFHDGPPLAVPGRQRGRAQFPTPPAGRQRHGKSVSDAAHAAHREARSVRGWHEWAGR